MGVLRFERRSKRPDNCVRPANHRMVAVAGFERAIPPRGVISTIGWLGQ